MVVKLPSYQNLVMYLNDPLLGLPGLQRTVRILRKSYLNYVVTYNFIHLAWNIMFLQIDRFHKSKKCRGKCSVWRKWRWKWNWHDEGVRRCSLWSCQEGLSNVFRSSIWHVKILLTVWLLVEVNGPIWKWTVFKVNGLDWRGKRPERCWKVQRH